MVLWFMFSCDSSWCRRQTVSPDSSQELGWEVEVATWITLNRATFSPQPPSAQGSTAIRWTRHMHKHMHRSTHFCHHTCEDFTLVKSIQERTVTIVKNQQPTDGHTEPKKGPKLCTIFTWTRIFNMLLFGRWSCWTSCCFVMPTRNQSIFRWDMLQNIASMWQWLDLDILWSMVHIKFAFSAFRPYLLAPPAESLRNPPDF